MIGCCVLKIDGYAQMIDALVGKLDDSLVIIGRCDDMINASFDNIDCNLIDTNTIC
jgi:hypothetical protein